MRLFVAIFPPAEIARRLDEVARGLALKGIAWTSPEQIHLTLNFLGSVEQTRVVGIERAIDESRRPVKPFLLQARGLGCFPNASRPRVIWAGLNGNPAALEGLKLNLDTSLASLDYAPDERPFHPHLTIGRVKIMSGRDRRLLAEILPRWRETEFGSWTAERVDLMRSELSPAGSRYALVRSFPLSASLSVTAE